jgi:hypothetical protein
MQEVTRLVVFCSGLEAQCKEQCVSTDGFFAIMDGLYQVAHVFVGGEAAAQLRPYQAHRGPHHGGGQEKLRPSTTATKPRYLLWMPLEGPTLNRNMNGIIKDMIRIGLFKSIFDTLY